MSPRGKNSGEAVRAPIPLIFDFLQRSTHAATGKTISSGAGARDTLQNCVVRKSGQNFQGFLHHLPEERDMANYIEKFQNPTNDGPSIVERKP